MGAAAFRKPGVPYYVQEGAEIISPEIRAPIQLKSADEGGEAVLQVGGLAAGVAGPYTGAIFLEPGPSDDGPAAAGLAIRSGAGETIVEVGADAEDAALLYIAGPQGVSRVFDEKYNPAVSLKDLTLSATNPLCAPDVGNVGELFRCEQAGVAASAVAAIGTNFEVPVSGWYSLQIEMKLGNSPAPAAPDINVPIVAVAGIDIGQTLSFAIAQGVVVEPYGLQEMVAQEFAAADIVVQNGNVVRQYVSQHLLEADTTYTFTLKSSSALWNIGSQGQLKAELIAMC
jgi:hypothetical protein